MAYSNVSKVNVLQTATNAAANIVAGADPDEDAQALFDRFVKVRDLILPDLEAARQQSEADAPAPSRNGHSGGGGNTYGGAGRQADPAKFVLADRYKDVAGLTMEQAYQTNPGYVHWLATKGKAEVVKRVANEYLASIGVTADPNFKKE